MPKHNVFWIGILCVVLSLFPNISRAETEEIFFSFTGEVTYVDGKNVYLQNGSQGILAHLDSGNGALIGQVAPGKVVTVKGTAVSFAQGGYVIPEITDAMIESIGDSGAEATAAEATLNALGNSLMATKVQLTATWDELEAAGLQVERPAEAPGGQQVCITGVLSANSKGLCLLGAEHEVLFTPTPEPTPTPTPTPTPSATPSATPTPKPLVLPVIKTQPKSVTVNNGKPAKFSVKATGKNLKYQWEVSADGGETWENVAKATKSSLSVKTVKAMAETENLYRCKVSNADGSMYTDAATLTVKLVPPVITGQPDNGSVRNGKNANLTIKAKGAKKYQWQVNDGSGWVDVPKATKNKLALKKVTFDMNGNLYRCVAINADGEVTSEVATLTVYLVPPTVTTEPKDATVKVGKTASFSVKAKEAKTYQWQVNDGSGWVDIPKATKNKLTVKKVIAADDGKQYRCIVTNADGSTASNTATLSVTE